MSPFRRHLLLYNDMELFFFHWCSYLQETSYWSIFNRFLSHSDFDSLIKQDCSLFVEDLSPPPPHCTVLLSLLPPNPLSWKAERKREWVKLPQLKVLSQNHIWWVWWVTVSNPRMALVPCIAISTGYILLVLFLCELARKVQNPPREE